MGTLLFDPTDYTISATGGNITGASLGAQLNAANVFIQTSGSGSQNGDITVNDNITWSGATTLSLSAHHDIILTAGSTITAAAGSIVGRADSEGTGSGTILGSGTINVGGTAIGYFNPSDWTNPMNMPYWSANVTAGGGKTGYALINDVAHLQLMSNDLFGHYALGKDIDASATAGWNSGRGFVPIGHTSDTDNTLLNLSLVFDGNGHTISNLYINRPSEQYVALFGGVGNPTIRGLWLLNVNVTGGFQTAGAVAHTGGITSNSYVTGTVTANNNTVGGLVALNAGTIINSYSTASVYGNTYVGGLVGSNWGTSAQVIDSYSTGAVTGSGSVGGLVGYNYNTGSTPVVNSYWDQQTSGQRTSAGGTGLTTAQMMTASTYSTWDTTNTWQVTGADYPRLLSPSSGTFVTPVAPVNPATPDNLTTVVATQSPALTTPSTQSSETIKSLAITTLSIQSSATSTQTVSNGTSSILGPTNSEDLTQVQITKGSTGTFNTDTRSSVGSPSGSPAQIASYEQQGIDAQKNGDYKDAVQNFREAADLLLQQVSLPQARVVIEMMKKAEIQEYFQDAEIASDLTHKTRLKDLPKDTAVVYTLIFPQRLDLILGIHSGLKKFSIPIDAAALSQKINKLRASLQKRSRWDYLTEAQRFYGLVIKPLELELNVNGINTIIFVPDGTLRTLPFAALHDGNRFLIEKYAVVVEPSLDLTDPRLIRRKNPQVLSAGLTESVQGFAPLSNVRNELDGIQGL